MRNNLPISECQAMKIYAQVDLAGNQVDEHQLEEAEPQNQAAIGEDVMRLHFFAD